MEISVRTDCSRALAAVSALRRLAEAPMADESFAAGVKDAGHILMAFERQEWEINSRGGGLWGPLAPSTLLARWRKSVGGFGRGGPRTPNRTRAARLAAAANFAAMFPILIDTGQALGSFMPGGPDNWDMIYPNGWQGGSLVTHLRYHQDGGGRLPQRRVMVAPNEKTLGRMQQSLSSGWKLAAQAALSTF